MTDTPEEILAEAVCDVLSADCEKLKAENDVLKAERQTAMERMTEAIERGDRFSHRAALAEAERDVLKARVAELQQLVDDVIDGSGMPYIRPLK